MSVSYRNGDGSSEAEHTSDETDKGSQGQEEPAASEVVKRLLKSPLEIDADPVLDPVDAIGFQLLAYPCPGAEAVDVVEAQKLTM
jgi:hypothetical protein